MVKGKVRIETSFDTSVRLGLAKAWANQYPADAELLVLAGTGKMCLERGLRNRQFAAAT